MADVLERLKAALADRYTIERELGSGGMATVYLAEDVKHERQVAVKVLRPELAAALGPERFHQEIKIAANLHHPHILPLYDSGDADGFLYYVMPYEEGQSLRDKLAHGGELPIAEAVRILRDVVDALSDAHEHGVVHRDIKPDNVLLTKHHALVTDFGVAKAVSDATGAHRLTTEGVALGTPAYMSPEQAAADKHIDHRADIYAVGAVAYELLTGRPPFTGTTPQELLSAQVTQTPDPVTKYRESVPPALAQLVMKCLAKKAADRWQTAEELLPQLEALATPSGGVTPIEMTPVGRDLKRRWMMLGGALGVASVIALIAVVAALPRESGVTLDSDRVLVAVFDNQTGDPTLSPLGVMAGQWITQGLQETGLVQVVPWLEAQQASRYVVSAIDSGHVRDPLRALAEETGAATIVYGTYYRRGDSVQYHVEVTDATRGQSLGSIAPETAPLTSPEGGIERLRQRVMGFLSITIDERIPTSVSSQMRPPTFAVYEAYDEGVRRYNRSGGYDEEAIPFLRRAFELDTSFVTPLKYMAIIHNNNGQFARSDSVVQVLERLSSGMSDYDRYWVRYLRARVDGNWDEAVRAIRRAAELAPGSKSVYNYAWAATRANRPREAIEVFLSLDPERGAMRGWTAYWYQFNVTMVLAGEYQLMLEQAQRYRSYHPEDDQDPWGWEILAFAALGRVDEMNRALEEIATQSNAGWIMSRVAQTLHAHGYDEAMLEVLSGAVDWFGARPPSESGTRANREALAGVLHLAGRNGEALAILNELVEEFPDRTTSRGWRAVVAIADGDTLRALQDAAWFEEHPYPLPRGYSSTFWRGVIAATLGQPEQALQLLQEAYSEGRGYFWQLAVEPVFAALREHPSLREWMRPRG
jgi:tetratricopeptide (TPR) repeat protein/tRNA A-37 threonylcarbamoyl transferase component Bud32